jgi:hypothetical protein
VLDSGSAGLQPVPQRRTDGCHATLPIIRRLARDYRLDLHDE